MHKCGSLGRQAKRAVRIILVSNERSHINSNDVNIISYIYLYATTRPSSSLTCVQVCVCVSYMNVCVYVTHARSSKLQRARARLNARVYRICLPMLAIALGRQSNFNTSRDRTRIESDPRHSSPPSSHATAPFTVLWSCVRLGATQLHIATTHLRGVCYSVCIRVSCERFLHGCVCVCGVQSVYSYRLHCRSSLAGRTQS